MKKPKARTAWILMVTSLPRAIALFVMTVAGISVGLPLAVFVVGLPVLAGTLAGAERMMAGERRLVTQWLNGSAGSGGWGIDAVFVDQPGVRSGWRGWLSTLGQAKMYRGALFGIVQFPVAIAAFTVAIVLPVTFAATTLAPLAYFVSERLFSYELFAEEWWLTEVSGWSPYFVSWVYGGIGAILLLFAPLLIRGLGRMYASWIVWVAGSEIAHPNPAVPFEATPMDRCEVAAVQASE